MMNWLLLFIPVSIAIGSSIQMALFVAPALVLLSLAIGPAPMNLAFLFAPGVAPR